ncbi:hypothetical protein GQ457_06G018260 [Hibiscus cannabinus]
MSENPKEVNPTLDHHGNANGRPPDLVTNLGIPAILERQASPLDVGEQQIAKKCKNSGSNTEHNIIGGDAIGMETDVDTGSQQQHLLNNPGKETYASMAARGRSGSGEHDTGRDSESDEIVVHDEDCIVDESGAFPTIRFAERVHDKIDWNMRNTIIVRLLGRSIGYKALLDRIYTLWRPRGDLQLVDLDNNYYLVRFENAQDYTDVLTDGPWTIFGNYLTVQPWSRSFTTSEKHPSNVMVWVRLPGLPYRYYCKALFRRIAQLVGKVVKVDYNTQAGERGKFARLAIMVDLNKPIKTCIGIDDFVQKLEYEGLNMICFSCGKYGHATDSCGSSSGTKSAPKRKWRRAAKINTRGEVHGLDQGHTGGSRFANLPAEEIRGEVSKDLAPSEATRGGSVVVGGHKESWDGSRLEHVVPQKTFTKNVAYLASNPERKNKKSSGAEPSLSEINVVPLADGTEAHIVQHTTLKCMGNHNAISIDEPGYDANGGTSSKGAKGRKGSFREVGEHRRLGFKVGKQNSERGAPTYSSMEWANNMSKHIDAIAAQDNLQLSVQARNRLLHADMELSSEEGGRSQIILWMPMI